jgi:outer membrane receptor protein involved in Fe transport
VNSVVKAANAGSAYITGIEVSFTQHFTYLPGLLNGLGLFANYSYATSRAHNVNPGNRTDSPALLRQAPNTWNISPTFDRGRLSLRSGISYNGANIFAYVFTDGVPGGIKGPSGDQYLFPHYQVDAQGSVFLGKGLTAIVSGLNLNNAGFGFYQGSPQYFIQREYYKPTYTFGLRWEMGREK